MSRRVKITFAEINKGKITIIPREKIVEVNRRIREGMKKHKNKF